MRPGPKFLRGAGVLATCFVTLGLAAPRTFGDEPTGGSRLARFFRLGSGNSSGSNTGAAGHGHANDVPGVATMARPPATNAEIPRGGIFPPPANPAPVPPPSTPDVADIGPSPRITAVPRVTRAATDADPIVTKVAVCRAEGNGTFGTFLQVFADGTVLDSQGVHKVGGDLMKPLMEALRQGDLYRLRGHCGAPSTDFVEQAHVVLYERAIGKLRATAFSYSGNPQGCDPSVRKLHKALEAIEMKVSTVPSQPSMASPGPNPAAVATGGTRVLNLTPPDPNP